MIEGIKNCGNENYLNNYWTNRMIQDLSKIVVKNENNDLGSVLKEPSESKPIYNLTFIDMSEHEQKIDKHINEKVIYKKKKMNPFFLEKKAVLGKKNNL